jgi:phage baseplate assembly protein W
VNIDVPLRLDPARRTSTVDDPAHLRQLVEQVLFTRPGERVNRPEFGSGLLQLVFAPNDDSLVGPTQLTVQAALQRWLGDLIEVESVEVTADDATVRVVVRYLVRRSQRQAVETFTRSW